MKLLKYPILFIITILCAASIAPEASSLVDPPKAVNEKLKSLYPNATGVQWEMEKENFEAEFLIAGKEVEVLISPTGEILGHDKEVASEELPSKIISSFSKSHPKFKITQAYSLWTTEGSQYKLIVVGLKSREHLWYDASGNLISKRTFEMAKEKKTKKFTSSPTTMGFSEYKNKWILPEILREISGIVFIDENKIACVQDELGTVFIYDLKSKSISDSIHFAAPGDYEGITLVENDIYVLRSDGLLTRITNYSTQPKTSEFKLKLDQSFQNFEGLCYDKNKNRLLIAPRIFDTQDHFVKNIYAFDLASHTFNHKPAFSINLTDKIFDNIITRKESLIPSEIMVNPADGKILFTDARNKYLLVSDSTGKLSKLLSLNPTVFAKTEGIAIAKDGSIYLSNEGKTGPATIIQITADKLN